MRVATLAAMTIVLASPAFAQAPTFALPTGEKTLTLEEREQQAAQDRAYKESLKKIPNQAASSDPWGSARAAETQKGAPKPKPATAVKKNGAAN